MLELFDSESIDRSAFEVRSEWMRMMGFSDEEIEEYCKKDPPCDFDDELGQYSAAFSIRELNS